MNLPLDRRKFLRSAGAVLALPLLESLTPQRVFAEAVKKPPRRMIAIQSNMGILSQNFFPTKEGKEFEDTTYLKILSAYKDRYTVFSGVSHPDVDGAHEAEKAFLSATPHPGSSSFKSGISVDQLAAEKLGSTTRFSSFTLSVNAEGTQGMSFSRSGVKIPAEKSPAALYKRMFLQGNKEEVEARLKELQHGRSMLDFVSDSVKRLDKQVTPADRDRLEQYYTAVRDLEKQLTQAQDWERKPKPKASIGEIKDVTEPKKLIDRFSQMLEIARLAFESDSTRVISIFINTFSIVPEIPGVKEETHSLTHHGGRPEALDQLTRIESAQFVALNEFIKNLNGIKEEGQTLFDRTMILYGAPMGNANSHANTNLPILLAGGGFKHAGHLTFDQKKNYPLPNLFVSMLQQLGLEVDRFATSTGTMRGMLPS